MFKWIRLLLILTVLFLSVLDRMVFTSQNSLPLGVTLLGYSLPVLSSGLWLTMALLIGTLTGFILSFLPLFIFNRSTERKDRKIARLEQEVARLRLSALKG